MGNRGSSNLIDTLVFIAIIIGNYAIVNFVGEISVGFIIIVATSIFWFPKLNFKDPILSWFFWLYVLLIGAQCFSEIFSSTNIVLKAKGVAVTISSLIVFCYFFYRFSRNLDLIKYYYLATAIARFMLPNELTERAGTEFGYYKFTLVPSLVYLLFFVVLSIQEKVNKQLISLIVAGVGGFFIITGARSSGLTVFLTGVASYLVLGRRSIDKKSIYRIGLVAVSLIYAAYALVYVPMVMSGELDGVGNSEQLKRAENPYNPLLLLMQGRTDSMVPFFAFADKPLVGHGYFARDPDLKYRTLLYLMSSGDEDLSEYDSSQLKVGNIPAHSVLGAYAAFYGVAALLLLLLFLGRVTNWGLMMFLQRNKYGIILASFMFSIWWNALFSPAAHFKTGIPIIASFIAALYYRQSRQKKIDEKNISSNSHLR